MLYIWDPPIGNLPKIRPRSFLYEGTISQKNQPEVSYKVVFILRALTVIFSYCKYLMLFHICCSSLESPLYLHTGVWDSIFADGVMVP